MSNKVKRELLKFLTVIGSNRLAHSLMFALYAVFLMEKGLSLFEVSLINVIFHIAIPLLEVPTGAIADLLGRKRSYLVAVTIDCVGFLLYGFGDSFGQFAIAELVLAIGYAFKSGSLDAHLWETISSHGEEEGMTEVQIDTSNRQANFLKELVYRFSGMLGGSVGPLIATRGVSLPWFASSFGAFVSGLIAYKYLPEDDASTEKISKRRYSELQAVMIDGVRIVWHNLELRRLAIISSISGFAVIPIFMYWGPYLKELSGDSGNMFLSIAWIGIESAIIFGAYIAKKYADKVGDKRAAVIGIVGLAVGVTGMAISGSFALALIALMFAEAANGLAVQGILVAKQTAINGEESGKTSGVVSIRATILSVMSIASEVGVIGGLLVGGFISEAVSIKTVFMLSATVLLASAVMQSYWLKRR